MDKYYIYMNKQIDSTNIKEAYNKYIKCKDKFGPDNILCKIYYDEYSEKVKPLIHTRLHKVYITKDNHSYINSFPWELG